MADPGSQPTNADAKTDHRREHVRFATRCFYGLGSISEGVKNTAFKPFLLLYSNHLFYYNYYNYYNYVPGHRSASRESGSHSCRHRFAS